MTNLWWPIELDTGTIRVEYESPDNMGGDSIDLVYKKELPDEGNPSPSPEFYATELEPRGIRTGPDDYDVEFDDVIVEGMPVDSLNVEVQQEHMHTGRREDKDHDEEKPRVSNEAHCGRREDEVMEEELEEAAKPDFPDVDGDGDLDLYLVQSGGLDELGQVVPNDGNILYLNEGDRFICSLKKFLNV